MSLNLKIKANDLTLIMKINLNPFDIATLHKEPL